MKKTPHYDVVQTDARQPWHMVLVGANGRPVTTGENQTSKRGVINAIKVDANDIPMVLKGKHKDGENIGYVTVNGQQRFIIYRDRRTIPAA